MINEFIFIADFFVEDVLGGGELNNEEFITLCKNSGIKIFKKKSQDITLDFLEINKNKKFIIGNFLFIKEECRNFIERKCEYVIYEHDHKYISTRNPALYKDFIAPKNHIINKDFYKNAKKIFCQSSFQKNIIEKNLNLDNIFNLSGNIWSLEVLNLMSSLNKKDKNNIFAIMDCKFSHKNTDGAIKLCENKNIKFELIKDSNYFIFLEKLSSYEGLVFIPQTPETLSRVIVEARMMGVKIITNKLIGACYEDWFLKKSDDLIEIMMNKREEIKNNILGVFNV